jgi:hypothetical protein
MSLLLRGHSRCAGLADYGQNVARGSHAHISVCIAGHATDVWRQNDFRDTPKDKIRRRRLGVEAVEAGEPYEAIRRTGHYSTIGERDQQVGSVACPVFGLNQTLIGCAAVSGPVARFTPAACKRHLRALRKAAGALTFELGSLLSGSIAKAEWNQPPDFAHAAVQHAP